MKKTGGTCVSTQEKCSPWNTIIMFKVFRLICPVIHHKVCLNFLWQLNTAVMILQGLFLNCCCHQLSISCFKRLYATFPANSSLWRSHSSLLSLPLCPPLLEVIVFFFTISNSETHLIRQKCQNDADEMSSLLWIQVNLEDATLVSFNNINVPEQILQ